MRKGSRCCLAWICMLFCLWAGVVRGQDANSDAVIDAIRSRNDIGESDQRRIAEWIQTRVDEFADQTSITERLIGCFRFRGYGGRSAAAVVVETVNCQVCVKARFLS